MAEGELETDADREAVDAGDGAVHVGYVVDPGVGLVAAGEPTRATPPERISHVTVTVALSIADTDPPS
ncbi:hypothetical protein QWJ26_15550 [Streptomyces sp. CSDS2]|uniref:hypothetical protein n=1 Tax=Streptomyces sp. CSDS2 TaxID=3055051 RepID=UPI0025B22401|nr:hypothetical protein [Streptomyces sp. CSDS2]MDN3261202.1 hypothetical protein [Streptomyces sp. CSDS2]